jgi:hypothetical protein
MLGKHERYGDDVMEPVIMPGFLPAPLSGTAEKSSAGVPQPAYAPVTVETALRGSDRQPGRSDVPPSGRPASGIAAEWPLQSFLKLGALPTAVPCARLRARILLREWRLAGLTADVELLVSELVTNGLQASRTLPQTPRVQMWLLADATRVLILVQDASPHPPARMNVDADAERGRGLQIVEAVSHGWGWYPARGGGKVVWALTRAGTTPGE